MKRILANAQHFGTLESEKLPPGLTEEQVLRLLHERSERARALMRESNALLDAHVDPFLADPLAFSDEQADGFSAFAQALYTLEKNVDIGLAYPLQKALLHRARERGDTDRLIEHLYFTGLIQMQWSRQMFIQGAIDCFVQGASYKDQYFTLHKKHTRLLVNKCIGNVYVAISVLRASDDDHTEFFNAVDEAVAFWSDPKVREKDPDFPWDAFINNSHHNICSWVDKLRSTKQDDRRLAQRIYQSVQALYHNEDDLYPTTAQFWTDSRTAYLHYASRYHVGQIGARQVVDAMLRLFDEVEIGDYSRDALYRMLHLSAIIFDYIELIPGLQPAQYEGQMQQMMQKVFAYCNAMPDDLDRYAINNFFSNFGPACLVGEQADDYIKTVLRLTTFTHLPTYVHSVMVGNLMALFAEHFIHRQPQLLVGIAGTSSAEEVVANKEAILSELRSAGLAHDAGKIAYVNTVALCSRRINDYEFSIIQHHTVLGHEMFAYCTDCGCIADVILGHHRWYDGTKGYPDSFDNTASPHKFAIDLCSVADSIEAATDVIGRSYAPGRTLAFVIGEIIEQSGTRYCPEIARALTDAELVARIDDALTNQRRRVYYAAYRDISSRAGR